MPTTTPHRATQTPVVTDADRRYAMERLRDWAYSEAHDRPSTWLVFLMLTGHAEPFPVADQLGYLEASMLAEALNAWANAPRVLTALLNEA